MPATTPSVFDKTFSAFLFDMDGTIINSIAAAERVWGAWAKRHGLDVETFLPTMHGARGVDTIRRLGLPGVDPEREADEIAVAEIADVEGVVPLPGAIAFLASLPPEKWAIVTSSPIELAKRRLAAAGISMPRTLVTAEDVKIGKPNPACYILGAERLGARPQDCLVFEDVAAGILAGEGAGADVMVMTATHTHPINTGHATISTYEGLEVRTDGNGSLQLVRK